MWSWVFILFPTDETVTHFCKFICVPELRAIPECSNKYRVFVLYLTRSLLLSDDLSDVYHVEVVVFQLFLDFCNFHCGRNPLQRDFRLHLCLQRLSVVEYIRLFNLIRRIL
jgi:hypothetical protein